MNALFHPRVALASEFLGYSQPRVTAPYSYPNTWGNAYGLLVPFFLFSWFGRAAGLAALRRAADPRLSRSSPSSTRSTAASGSGSRVSVDLAGRAAAGSPVTCGPCWPAALAAGVLAIGLVATPLGRHHQHPAGHPAQRRTPPGHRRRGDPDDLGRPRRSSGTAAPGRWSATSPRSPGPAAPGCHQCSAPPLGTQGFLWGLVFMTGFIGAGLLLTFLLWQFVINARRQLDAGAARVDGAARQHLLLPVLRRARPAHARDDDDRRARGPGPLPCCRLPRDEGTMSAPVPAAWPSC